MKILHLSKFYYPELGGIENVVLTLAEGAKKKGEIVSVHCFSNFYRTQEINHVEVKRSSYISIFNQPISLKYILNALKESKKFDIVHIHFPNFLAALIVLFMSSRSKIIIHWHADYPKLNSIIDFIINMIISFTLERASSIIVTSKQYSDGSITLKKHKAKITIIPIGIEKTNLKSIQYAKIRPDIINLFKKKEVANVLAVGRLVKYKGFKNLILAAKKLKPNIQIIIAGEGPEANYLSNLISSLKLEMKVKLIGKITNTELDYIYKNSNIFCLPSINKQEAFGVVQLEAMKFKLPIISTEIDGSGVSWVNKNYVSGITVPVNKPEMITDSIHRIINNPDLSNSLSNGAYKRFKNKFTADTFVKNTLKLYYDLTKQG